MPKLFAISALVLAFAATLAVPAASQAASPGQRVDMKVLLLAANGNEPSYDAWKSQLKREGVPFDTFVANDRHAAGINLTSDLLSDGSTRAKYQAVVLATGGLRDCSVSPCVSTLSQTEWDTLNAYEKTFGIRQLTAYAYPSPDYGLNWPTAAGDLGGTTANLTTSGKLAFSDLKGPVGFDSGGYGYQATPIDPAKFETLVQGPNSSALLGVFTHNDGRQEMVQTFDGNSSQLHTQLLRHGELSWVTRGVYFGYAHNYLELQVDDVFLTNGRWDTTTNATSFDPNREIRMTGSDVTRAVNWSKSTGVRLDMVFNGYGSNEYVSDRGSDPLLTALQATKSSFSWINHTFAHTNLDCSTLTQIQSEIQKNIDWAAAKGLPIRKNELVTGEHSGLPNMTPAPLNTPTFNTASPATTGGSLATGTYDYAITAYNANGETTASTTTHTASGADGANAVALSWDAQGSDATRSCGASGFRIYRKASGSDAWTQVASVGPTDVSYTDTGASGTAGAPPTSNGATRGPVPQNPYLVSALTSTKIEDLATDASRPYPSNPLDVSSPLLAPGTQFNDGPALTFPRYPTSAYYNVATRAEQLDEYNHIYLPPSQGGACVDSATNTCRSTPATWSDYLNSEASIMMRHVTGNDPRPHYVHQSNLAEDGVMYDLVNAALDRYNTYFKPGLDQLTPTQIDDSLDQVAKWNKALAAGDVSGYIRDGQVFVQNSNATTAIDVPLTGTTAGALYGKQRMGWKRVNAAKSVTVGLNDPKAGANPAITGTAASGQTLTASTGGWTGTAPIAYAYQWQRCASTGVCSNIPGATTSTYGVTAADVGYQLQVVVSASNWMSSYSQNSSGMTAAVTG